MVDKYLSQIDGLLLSGGVDVAPHYFGQQPHRNLASISPERDEIELMLAEKAMSLDKPIFAICRGMQVVNVAAGGTLYQDIDSQIEDVYKHQQKAPRWHATHDVSVGKNTLLGDILDDDIHNFMTNSFHHQAVYEAPESFIVSAKAEDGVVEAMESQRHTFVLCVQWHPEMMYEYHSSMRKIFDRFIAECCEEVEC